MELYLVDSEVLQGFFEILHAEGPAPRCFLNPVAFGAEFGGVSFNSARLVCRRGREFLVETTANL